MKRTILILAIVAVSIVIYRDYLRKNHPMPNGLNDEECLGKIFSQFGTKRLDQFDYRGCERYDRR